LTIKPNSFEKKEEKREDENKCGTRRKISGEKTLLRCFFSFFRLKFILFLFFFLLSLSLSLSLSTLHDSLGAGQRGGG